MPFFCSEKLKFAIRKIDPPRLRPRAEVLPRRRAELPQQPPATDAGPPTSASPSPPAPSAAPSNGAPSAIKGLWRPVRGGGGTTESAAAVRRPSGPASGGAPPSCARPEAWRRLKRVDYCRLRCAPPSSTVTTNMQPEFSLQPSPIYTCDLTTAGRDAPPWRITLRHRLGHRHRHRLGRRRRHRLGHRHRLGRREEEAEQPAEHLHRDVRVRVRVRVS